MLQVNPGSKAEEAGLREGDVIDEINGIQPVTLEEAKRLQKISDSGLCLRFTRKVPSNRVKSGGRSSDDSEGKTITSKGASINYVSKRGGGG